jgi:hypothetical protein
VNVDAEVLYTQIPLADIAAKTMHINTIGTTKDFIANDHFLSMPERPRVEAYPCV